VACSGVENMRVRNISAAVLATAVIFGLSSQAFAVPFTGNLSLNGTDTFTANSITFVNPANIGSDSGNLAVLGTCTGCVTMDSFTSASTNFLVYSATNNLNTTTLTLNSAVFTETPNGIGGFNLDITGTGTATLTGFDPTVGRFELTTQNDGTAAAFTFSSTTVVAPVPEPSTWAMMILGFMGVGFMAYRRRGNGPSLRLV
jgi:hypothetical protein